jgi:hypothetical protein
MRANNTDILVYPVRKVGLECFLPIHAAPLGNMTPESEFLLICRNMLANCSTSIGFRVRSYVYASALWDCAVLFLLYVPPGNYDVILITKLDVARCGYSRWRILFCQ